METPKKRLSKYWCSVPHCQCDIRNIYIKADRFHLMLTTANKERKQIYFKEVIVSALKSLIQIK